MNSVDALIRLYPQSWRRRHEAEFRDALSSTIGSSGRLPFREVRSTLAGALRERARGDSATPRQLVRSALGDSFIFTSGLIIAISIAVTLQQGWPDSWYPSVLLTIAVVVFVSSMVSSRVFRVTAIAFAPMFWFFVSTVVASPPDVQVAHGAAAVVALSALSFIGVALAIRRRFLPAALLQLPMVVMVVWGTVSSWRNGGPYLAAQVPVEVRVAWAFPVFLMILALTATAELVTRGTGRRLTVRPLHLVTLAIGLAMGLAPAPVAVMVGVVVAALAWWNPRPAIVVLTWPLAYAVANTSSLLVWTSSRDQLEWRYLIPLVASVPFALFLRHCATRVHRLR